MNKPTPNPHSTESAEDDDPNEDYGDYVDAIISNREKSKKEKGAKAGYCMHEDCISTQDGYSDYCDDHQDKRPVLQELSLDVFIHEFQKMRPPTCDIDKEAVYRLESQAELLENVKKKLRFECYCNNEGDCSFCKILQALKGKN